MKKLFVVLTMLAAMMMGAGAANATSSLPPVPTDPTSVLGEGVVAPPPGDDAALIIQITGPVLDANGCLVVPVPKFPEYFGYSVAYVDGTAVVTAAIYPEHQRYVDLTLTDRTGAADVITFEPLAVGSGCVGALPEPVPSPAPVVPPVPSPEPVPAPPVEPVPAPVEVQQVPAPEPVPAGTAERVAAGEELAYTGAEDAALAGIAASVLTGGVALVWLARRMRTA